MAEMQITKKLFRKKIVATETIDGVSFKVTGERGFFTGPFYSAGAKSEDKNGLHLTTTRLGKFKDVAEDLRCDEKTKKGISLLRDVAAALSDVNASLILCFNDEQLKLISVLHRGPGTLAELCEISGTKGSTSYRSIIRLHSLGIVDKGIGLKPVFTLTVFGKKVLDELMEYRRFQLIQEGLKNS